MHQKTISIQTLMKYAFLAAVTTAPFDELLAWEVGSFTIRFAQIFLLVGGVLLLMFVHQRKSVKIPAGGFLLLALLAFNFLLCFGPTNENVLVLFGYEVWFALDVIFVFLAVNCIDVQTDQKLFETAFALPFFFSAIACLFQVAISFCGLTLFTDQFFGALNRADAFCSEPSYYACFALPMWVAISYRIEQTQGEVPKRIKLFWATITMSIILSTSRMAYLMVGMWIVFRVLICLVLTRRKSLRNYIYMASAILAMLLLYIAFYNIAIFNAQASHPQFVSRLTNTNGLDMPRITGMLSTLDTFLRKNFFVGSSLGGVYCGVREIHPDLIQVANLFAELLVAFGLPGFALLLIWFFQISRMTFRQKETSKFIPALWWGIVWQIGILQFNNNGLRVYLWANIAILCALLPKSEIHWSKENGFSYRTSIQCNIPSGPLR